MRELIFAFKILTLPVPLPEVFATTQPDPVKLPTSPEDLSAPLITKHKALKVILGLVWVNKFLKRSLIISSKLC